MMRRIFLSFLAAAALLGVACDAPDDGLVVQINPPADLTPGRDFNSINLEVRYEGASRILAGNDVPKIDASTEKPYRIYVKKGDHPTRDVTITAELYLNGSMQKSSLPLTTTFPEDGFAVVDVKFDTQ